MGRALFAHAVLIGSMTAAACAPAATTVPPSSAPSAGSTASAVLPAPSGDFSDSFDIGGYSLYLTCQGSGSPTVILEAGLGGGFNVWRDVQDTVSKTTRVCSYARAGISMSDSRPPGTFTKDGVSTGFMAGETWKLLQAARVPGPYVVVGHSYGGMLVRLFAFQHPEAVTGMVLVDSSSVQQFEGDVLGGDGAWSDGLILVNKDASATELRQVESLGSIPLVVLTQSELNGDLEAPWSRFQDELATLSTNSLHMVAYPSSHMIMFDQEALVEEGIKAVVESATAHSDLPACEPRFSALHALCLETTMTARLDAWSAERDAIKPEAGKFPSGTYRETLTAADFEAVTGTTADFKKIVSTWLFADGHWSVSVVIDGSSVPELHEGRYAEANGVLTLVVPVDWKTPMTSGVYQLRWTKEANGTIDFEQIDDWPREPDWAVPYVRVGPAT